MTCIVGIETEEGVVLAADSLITNGSDDCIYSSESKITDRGPWLIASTGSLRDGQLLASADGIESAATITDVIEHARKALREGGSLRVDSGVEQGVEFLAARGRELFMVSEDWSSVRPKNGRIAIGSGSDFARGVLEALLDLDGEERVSKSEGQRVALAAVRAAIKCNTSVGGPIDIRCTSATPSPSTPTVSPTQP